MHTPTYSLLAFQLTLLCIHAVMSWLKCKFLLWLSLPCSSLPRTMTRMQFQRCENVEEATNAFHEHGFCIIRSGLSPQTLTKWNLSLLNRVPDLIANPCAYRGSGRFTFNVLGYELKFCPHFAEFRALSTLHTLLASIHGCSPNPANTWWENSCAYYVKGNGGDVCLAGEPMYQPLHSDWARYPLHEAQFGYPLVASVALMSIPCTFAPIRIISKQVNVGTKLPNDDQGTIWGSVHVGCLEQGDILLRDCRIPHSGTPNLTAFHRILPAIIVFSPEWCSRMWGTSTLCLANCNCFHSLFDNGLKVQQASLMAKLFLCYRTWKYHYMYHPIALEYDAECMFRRHCLVVPFQLWRLEVSLRRDLPNSVA